MASGYLTAMGRDSATLGLTRSLEDYIRAIYVLRRKKRVVRVKDIASFLNVKPSSVTTSLKRLATAGLVDYEKREYVDLTEEGLRVAEELSERYRNIKDFLVRVLGVPEDIAEVDACSMEHYLHPETAERLKRFIEFVSKSPEELGPRFLEYFKRYYEEERVEGD